MRLTIERMRTLVLAAGSLLILALVVFLVIGHFRSRFNLREIPKRLGVNIQQEANGVTYTQARGGHTLFKIHASKVVQLKQGGRALLHDVQIELYSEDGSQVDRIAGDEFEYDQKEGRAIAAGPVEITLTRPSESPAIAPKAVPGRTAKSTPLANVEHSAEQGEIHVKTSGLTFDQQSGVATTNQRVEFTVTQGNGSSVGARFDSQNGHLVLDHAVELNVRRGPETVLLHANHAEFSRGDLMCRLEAANASFRGGEAAAGDADLLFRADGSVVSLDATSGFSLLTKTQARIAAPHGWLQFDEHNQPRKGRLDGGATMDSAGNGRLMHAASPMADLQFTEQGELRRVHLERDVTMHSEETAAAANGHGALLRTTRDWRSPVADVEFRSAGKGQVEVAQVEGTGGVTITGTTQRDTGPAMPSRMSADQVTGRFAARGALSGIIGTGKASIEQMTASGVKQTVSGDRVEASFVASPLRTAEPRGRNAVAVAGSAAATEIQSATVDGNVVLVQEPASKPGVATPAAVRATAGKATYEGAGDWLHLTINPRIEDGGLQLTADRVDVKQSSGDAFAHGNVKSTWTGPANGSASAKPGPGGLTLGGQGPAHVIASEAQLQQSTGEATFRGQARLWQGANSISAAVIVLDRPRQTVVAHGGSAIDPVKVVFLSMGNPSALSNGKPRSSSPAAPSVVRVRGGDLKYSGAERKALMRGGVAGSVVAETAEATTTSSEVELTLLPAENHVREEGGAAQVDRVMATGHVSVKSEGRQGTGERLVYTADTGQYVLTGTAAEPPRMTEPARGVITGESLIFNSRDDSVSIEGGGRKTTTETTAPK